MSREDLKDDKSFHLFPKLIMACKKEYEDEQKLFDRALQVYNSNYTQPTGVQNKKDGVTMGTNYMYAWVQQSQAQVCPAQSRVSIEPRRDEYVGRAAFRSALYNDYHYRLDTAEDLRWLHRWASLCRRGIWKAVWDFNEDTPKFIPVNPRQVWFDRDASKWDEVRWLIQATAVTKDEFRKRREPQRIEGEVEPPLYEFMADEDFDRIAFTSLPKWMRSSTTRGTVNSAKHSTSNLLEWVVVYECYDFRSGRFYHFLEGQGYPLLADELPYHDSIPRNFFRFVYSENMEDLSGMSDFELTEAVQLRLDEIDNLEMWYTKTSIPQVWANQNSVKDRDEVDKNWRRGRTPNGLNWMATSERSAISDIFFTAPQPTLPINFDVMRRRCQEIIEFILGFPGFSHGRLGDTELATEVAAAQSHDETRKAERKRVVNKAIEWSTRVMDAMCRAYMPEDTVIPLRVVDMQAAHELTTELLGYDDPDERPLDFDYEVLADEGSEHNRAVKFRRLNEAMANPVVMESPHTDQTLLVREFWRLLGMPKAFVETPPQPAPEEQPPEEGESPEAMPMGGQDMAELTPPGMVVPGGELQVPGTQGVESGIADALAAGGAAGGPGTSGVAQALQGQPY